ncbi:sulfite transporter TauE/SafE [Carbonactinospora thermoautotrophica]|uniref:sulfite exporter TauE/SafE family protein n=1 Tax=Carbonactinospora thermoautotrophica TaxID=1469144 RepID=UPI00226FAB66|nr:sulfite exporter TauE/SafE family protein [Carbonactinospora thermoautotrophica]MCX9190125.1 sulfite transporter TauE/SafE [Carbonactinospora thermoautotrophica]
MAPGRLIAAGLVVALGSCLQGSIGFGMNLFAVPLVALIEPVLVPVPLLILAGVLSLFVGVRERASPHVQGVGWSLLGRLPGTLAGAYAVAVLSERELAVVFGVIILVGVLLSAVGWAPHPTAPTLFTAGVASGLMGTATSVGGPPIALVYQRTPGPRVRATLSAYFVAGTAISVGTLAVFGQVRTGQLVASCCLRCSASRCPARRVLDRGYLSPAVLSVSGVSALVLIVKTLV